MEVEIDGRYITCLEADGDRFAIFSKELRGRSRLVMFTVLLYHPLKRVPPHIMPIDIHRMIPVYTASHCPQTQQELVDMLADKYNCREPNCPWHPARTISFLEQSDEPEIMEITAPYQPPHPIKGYMEKSWSLKTGSTPPPYVTLDSRRRPAQVAHIIPEDLPVSPPAYIPQAPFRPTAASPVNIPLSQSPASQPNTPRPPHLEAFGPPAPPPSILWPHLVTAVPEPAEPPVLPRGQHPADHLLDSSEENDGYFYGYEPVAVVRRRAELRGLDPVYLRGNIDCPACGTAPCLDCTCDCPMDHTRAADLSLSTSRLPQ